MVLDSKAMTWGSSQGLDSATLKKARIPIYGKWYFPDLPANVPLVNLNTGETETFPPGYRAGAILYVKREDLERAGLGPFKRAEPTPPPAPAPAAAAAEPVAAAPTPPRPAAPVPPRPSATATAAPAPHQPPPDLPPPHLEPTHLAPNIAQGPAHEAAISHETYGTGEMSAAAIAREHSHPGPSVYITIALILAVITAIEVLTFYMPQFQPVLVEVLIVLSAAKFLLVAMFFMHLKFDHTSFAVYFGGGLLLAMSIFLGVMFLTIGSIGWPAGY